MRKLLGHGRQLPFDNFEHSARNINDATPLSNDQIPDAKVTGRIFRLAKIRVSGSSGEMPSIGIELGYRMFGISAAWIFIAERWHDSSRGFQATVGNTKGAFVA